MKNIIDQQGENKPTTDLINLKRGFQELKARQAATARFALTPDGLVGIQSAIDTVSAAGGGTVLLRNGTYVVTSNIALPSGVSLVGESLGGVTLVFAGPFSIVIDGVAAYSTGTISLTKGSAIVTGSGTSWLTNLTLGHEIKIDGSPTRIASVDGDTQITLVSKYTGITSSGVSYLAAIFNTGAVIENLVIIAQAGSSTAITSTYSDILEINSVIIQSPTQTAMTITDSARTKADTLIIDAAGTTGISLTRVDLSNFTRAVASNCGLNGIMLDTCTGAIFTSCPSNDNAGRGYLITSCTATALFLCQATSNLNSGVTVQSSSFTTFNGGLFSNNGNAGINIASGSAYNSLNSGFICTQNTTYGVIISSGAVKTTLIGGMLPSNTSGSVSDAGTGTINVNGQT